jgi:hemerythrin-like domain-containing protein
VNDHQAEPMSVMETRLAHDVHRAATSLLAEAATLSGAPLATLAELRDFLVANLHHHHESEDNELWPLLAAADPDAAARLGELTGEHERLEAALDTLAGLPVQDEADRARLAEAAATVRDILRVHLEHEEPLLFPALRAHMPADTWTEFSRKVIATGPLVGAHLMVGFLDQVGNAEDVEKVFANMPEPAREFIPVMRQQAQAALRDLRAES